MYARLGRTARHRVRAALYLKRDASQRRNVLHVVCDAMHVQVAGVPRLCTSFYLHPLPSSHVFSPPCPITSNAAAQFARRCRLENFACVTATPTRRRRHFLHAARRTPPLPLSVALARTRASLSCCCLAGLTSTTFAFANAERHGQRHSEHLLWGAQ